MAPELVALWRRTGFAACSALPVFRVAALNRRSFKGITKMSLKAVLVRHFPALGALKRLAVAGVQSIPIMRRTYAQHGEDLLASELLADFDLSSGLYVDVGANHPTDISNTYLFYRQGFRGIVVEPNPELVRLFGRFRPRDISLSIACGRAAGVASFSISKTPVLSSLTSENAGDIWKVMRVPVLTLDQVVASIAPEWISLLSIDVEGHSLDVLAGAKETLQRTYLICIEAVESSDEERDVKLALDAAEFQIIRRVDCNLFAVNSREERFRRYRRPPKI